MDRKRRVMFQIVALVLSILVLAFVVTCSVARQKPAASSPSASADPSQDAASPAAGEDRDNAYGIIGPATKADPHTLRRAVQSLSAPAPTGAPSQTAPKTTATAEKP
jgi:hypothetical protein